MTNIETFEQAIEAIAVSVEGIDAAQRIEGRRLGDVPLAVLIASLSRCEVSTEFDLKEDARGLDADNTDDAWI